MKKIFVVLIIIVVLSAALVLAMGPLQKLIMKNAVETMSETGEPANLLEKPKYNSTLEFESYQKLKEAFASKEVSKFCGEVDYGSAFKSMVDKLESGDLSHAIPHLDGAVIPFGNNNNKNVAFYTCSKYYLPWFEHKLSVGEKNLSVMVTYPSVLGNEDVNSAKTYLDLLKVLSPATVEKDDFKKNYEEKEITLNGGVTVKALVGEWSDRSDIEIMYYYNDVMVILNADKSVLTDEFLSKFGF